MNIYHPNDTDCAGWEGHDGSAPPGNPSMFVEESLDEDELDTISVDDENYILFGAEGYPGQRIRFAIDELPDTVLNIALTFKGYGKDAWDPPTYGWYLWIWNKTTTTWELLDSHAGSSKATLTGSKSSGCTDYIDGSGYIHGLVMADTDHASRGSYLYYAKCVVAIPDPQYIIGAGGIASLEAFGGPQLNLGISGAGGIASGEAFGICAVAAYSPWKLYTKIEDALYSLKLKEV